MKVETYLPVFPGFYGTLFEPEEDQEIDSINYNRSEKGLPEITYDDCKWDYEEHRNRVARACCGVIEHELKGIIDKNIDITFQDIHSPREYNFTNDSINVEIDLDINKTKEYLKENEDEFAEFLKERFTSRSGFISFFSNQVIDWYNLIDNQEKYETVIGSVLDFILENEGYRHDNLYEDVMGETYILAINYDELSGETSK